jgi:ATP-dependent DNA helicase RecG
VGGWDITTFLNKSKLCVAGRITRTALLLLGKPESVHLISPAPARITWVLRDEQKREKDYRHFDPPLLLASDQLLQKIRNLTIRQLPSGTLFPHEVT